MNWSTLEGEDDTAEKEQQEDDGKNEKKVLHTVSFHDSPLFAWQNSIFFSGLHLLRDISFDTHLPPPERA